MRAILIGNKILDYTLTDKQLKFINDSDVIIRNNRLNNIRQTGNRIDVWWVDICRDFFNLFDKSIDISGVKDIYLNKYGSYCLDHYPHFKAAFVKTFKNTNLNKQAVIHKSPNKYSHFELNNHPEWWPINNPIENKTAATTAVICLSHMIEIYKDYDFYVFGMDIDNRGQLFKELSMWKNSWHANAGEYEERYLKELLSVGKIKDFEKSW